MLYRVLAVTAGWILLFFICCPAYQMRFLLDLASRAISRLTVVNPYLCTAIHMGVVENLCYPERTLLSAQMAGNVRDFCSLTELTNILFMIKPR